MPYRYAETWLEDRYPYYSDQPTFDDDGFVVDPATLTNLRDMALEVTAANQMKAIENDPVVANVA